ncbi:MAG: hypothetical protein ACR2H4_11455 [Pyrinomonadaceae bacterium]
MGNINYGRLIAGALLAAVFYFIADGTIHGAVLENDHMAAITAAGKPVVHDPTAYFYFAVFDLGKGLVAMLIYVAARVPCKPGPKTAVVAGLITWLAVEVLPAIAAMPFPFYEKSFYLKVIAFELVPMVIGAILGAWVYKEPVAE